MPEVIAMAAKKMRLAGCALFLLLVMSWLAAADYVYVANPYIGDDSLGTIVRLRASDLGIVEKINQSGHDPDLAAVNQ